MKRIFEDLKTYLFTGLVAAIILGFLGFILKMVLDLISPLRIISTLLFGKPLPGSEIIVALLIILILGMLSRFLEKRKPEGKNQPPNLIGYIKLAKNIAVNLKKTLPVLVKIEGKYLLGFTANNSFPPANQATGENLVMVVILSTPAPYTGFTMLVPAKDLIPLPGKRSQLIKEVLRIIISGGLVNS